jgi:hypothetical protein
MTNFRFQNARYSNKNYIVVFDTFYPLYSVNTSGWKTSNLKITDMYVKDVCTFMIIFYSILLRRRRVPDKVCGENKNTRCMFSTIFLKIMPFVR